ncbi:MAG: DegT/DnrJ/EryC1/StrS family aminotransferase [candidate division WS1 bacterium]|jgi:dTDP-4-amino-4,6-dideoxygalactose transaminase|nr:DegT/DnrJ/EryC1/StrS family aminotransferase [candidate division WS1 bacterium]
MYRIGQEEVDEVAKVLLSKQWMRGGDPAAGHLQEVERFEAEWAETLGVSYVLLMNGGGTAGIVCALAALGIGPGDEVIVPAYTWLATATSVLTVGAIPVLAEVDESLGLDPEDFERKLGPRVKAVIPVHMAGRPANLARILEVAHAHDIKVVEDSCQCDGGSYQGRRTGSWGDAGAFSLNYYKIISCGEGGVLVTNDRELYERAFIFHDPGAGFRRDANQRATPLFVAQQYRASEIMGAIARIQLQRLEGILADLRRHQRRIITELAGQPGLRLAPSNDPEGDCGVVVAWQFDSEDDARTFAAAAPGGYIGIDHGKHVFTNWDALIERRVMHHPAMNPFNFEANQGARADYSPEVCPRTLDLLRRTYFYAIDPDWTEEEVAARIETLAAAGKAVA